ncbi:single-strand binding protein (plasmid) [Alteromonas mediterranea 615]|uniref:Single-stranded DNA-binding protein n=1 Tax=Alteromonas mediterranea 615 TaxID=1300253 RepID=S5AJ42_9ALTE|nr:single-strand binding protein [Alteromonas mediterranea 615]
MSQGFFEVKAKANIGSIEFNTLPSGDLVANLSLAATKKYKDNQGQQQEKTTWISATAYRRTAELLDMLAQQGTEIFVTGSLVEDKWVDQNNQNRSKVGIVIDTFDVLRRGKEHQNAQNNANYNQSNGQGYNQAPNQGYNNQGYQQPNNRRNNAQGGYQQQGNYQRQPMSQRAS